MAKNDYQHEGNDWSSQFQAPLRVEMGENSIGPENPEEKR